MIKVVTMTQQSLQKAYPTGDSFLRDSFVIISLAVRGKLVSEQ